MRKGGSHKVKQTVRELCSLKLIYATTLPLLGKTSLLVKNSLTLMRIV